MKTLMMINFVIAVLFFICYCYQMVYFFIPFIQKFIDRRKNKIQNTKTEPIHRFAVMIAARNEEKVIGQLIKSIQNQTYPKKLVDIFIVADNCTDNTAHICRDAGAVVWERQNTELVGKGYALQFLSQKIRENYPADRYDGFFIFDSDNILDENYIFEMDAVFSKGARIVTGYRNSKNFGDSWISAGYGVWFLRESQFLNLAREALGTSSVILGTGFLFHRDIFNRDNGWQYLMMSEDMEFTVSNVLRGENIHYCSKAILYDEQPVKFSQSWIQRARWVKGYLQVFGKYGTELIKGALFKRMFSCFDIFMSIIPAIFLTIVSFLVNIITAVYGLFTGVPLLSLVIPALQGLASSYLLFLVIGITAVVCERKLIHCSWKKLILYTFTFPIFMLTYIPIAIYAQFSKVTWKPIQHSHSVSLEEIRRS